MAQLLEDRHTAAAMLGRQRAGDIAGPQETDRLFAQEVMSGEAEYLKGFIKDVLNGRYVNEDGVDVASMRRRAHAYTGRLVGTANEMFCLSSVLYRFRWVMAGLEDHCSRCPELAAGGPYRWDQLPTVPGANGTPCLFRCKCRLERDDGVSGFEMVE